MAEVVTITVDGYASGQFDFQTVLAQRGGNPSVDQLVARLVDAEMNAGKFIAVTILGHSDRDDTPGLSADARRASELRASTARGLNALQSLLERLQAGVQARGGTIPADWPSAQSCSATFVAVGAANLLHLNPANNEAQRKENRRVDLVFMELPA